jgi:hypothetical protein
MPGSSNNSTGSLPRSKGAHAGAFLRVYGQSFDAAPLQELYREFDDAAAPFVGGHR